MQARGLWSGLGRCALTALAIGMLILVGGCSSGISRFDSPGPSLAGNDAPLADPSTTAAIPVPQETVYTPGSSETYRGGQLARSSLPPPSPSRTPQAIPAAYSPAASSLRPQRTAYAANPALRPKPPMLRGVAERPSSRTVTVGPGDNLYTLSKRYDVAIEDIKAANRLDTARLRLGQKLIIPGAAASPETEASRRARTYKVQEGDTPRLIAQRLGV